jgi:hypothetical protein
MPDESRAEVLGGGTVVKKSQNCAEIPKIVFGATMQFWLKTNYIMIQNKEYKTIFLNFKHFVP